MEYTYGYRKPYLLNMNWVPGGPLYFEVALASDHKTLKKVKILDKYTALESRFLNVCESTPLFTKRHQKGQLFQRFQWLMLHSSETFIEIYELEFGFDSKKPDNVTLILVGMKNMLLKNKVPEVDVSRFYPMFDDDGDVIGTHILPKDDGVVQKRSLRASKATPLRDSL